MNLSEGVLCPNFRHRSLKIDVKQILEVFGGSFALIINHANRTATVRPRLDLRQANVPKRESRKHFKEHRSSFVVSEDDACFERPIRARNDRFARQHHEPRHVVWIVLDSVRQDLQTVELRGAGARDRRRVAEAVRGDELCGAGCVVDCLTRHVEAEFRERVLALR